MHDGVGVEGAAPAGLAPFEPGGEAMRAALAHREAPGIAGSAVLQHKFTVTRAVEERSAERIWHRNRFGRCLGHCVCFPGGISGLDELEHELVLGLRWVRRVLVPWIVRIAQERRFLHQLESRGLDL